MRFKSLSWVSSVLLGKSCDDFQIANYQIHSDFIGEGDLFFALPGNTVDGHHFLSRVAAQGGKAAVVSQGYLGPSFGLHLIFVPDVVLALQLLARLSLEESPSKIIGVTGSVGKTTTKDWIYHFLRGKYKALKTEASQNSKLTLPLTVLNRAGAEEVLVLEMGMSEPGEIARLVEIAPPEIAVLTKVSLAHAAYFPEGILQIAKNKAMIFSHPKTHTAIFDREFVKDTPCPKQIPFSLEEAFPIPSPFVETHLTHNFRIAALAAREMGLPWEEIRFLSQSLSMPKKRFEKIIKNGVLFINDAYNANPASMRAALENLPSAKRKIAVLGSMKELGVFSQAAHEEIGRLANTKVDFVCGLGEEVNALCAQMGEKGKMFLDHGSIAKYLQMILQEGDLVLIKGSFSMSMDKVLELLT